MGCKLSNQPTKMISITVTEEDKKNIEKGAGDRTDDKDCHRLDEQVNVCLECKEVNTMKSITRRFLRLSALATVTQLKKFVALKVLNSIDLYKDVSTFHLKKSHALQRFLKTFSFNFLPKH